MSNHLINNSFVININSSIKEAMESITDNQRGTIIVIDDDFYVQGIVADGDIRRALLRGAAMMTPISKIINTNPTVLNKNDIENGKAEKIFNEEAQINILPVIDENNKLIDIVVRSPHKRKEF
ncbi:CBS domain-containing protein [Patescibacteria group bacterium]|nr:CBS domain-containing protein [Patescibacteria group bacterium]